MRKKVNTIAREVYDNIEKDVESVHPWQYQNANLQSVNYNAIIDDIKTYWNQQARFREGFKYENGNIYVPNFFTKINGINKNKKDYIEFIKFLKDSMNTLILDEDFRIYKVGFNELEKLDKFPLEQSYLSNSKNFYEPTVKNVLKYNFLGYNINIGNYTFDKITKSKQEVVLNVLMHMIKTRDLGKYELESLCQIVFGLDEKIITLINNFDYSFDVPKIVVTNVKENERMALLLDFLNEMAFDIIILEPSGRTNVEKYIDIQQMSLGYFVDNFDVEEESKTTLEKTQELLNVPKKDRCYIYLTIMTIFVIAMQLFCNIGWLNTIVQIIYAIVTLVCWIDEDVNNRKRLFGSLSGWGCVVVIILLCIRGGIALSNATDDPTSTHDGFEIVENYQEIEENEFILKSKVDSLITNGSESLKLYIENNSTNKEPFYFEIYNGDTKIYKSTKIYPNEYVIVVDLDLSYYFTIGDHNLTINYYKYDGNGNSIYIGKQKIIAHVVDTQEDLDKALMEYGLDF